jgi:hypothetical protein
MRPYLFSPLCYVRSPTSWLVYPMKGSSVSISISLGLYGWFAIPWECFFDGGSKSSKPPLT